MNKLLMKIVPCYLILFSLYASFNVTFAQSKGKTADTNHIPENEVVIHSPLDDMGTTKTTNSQKKENNLNSKESENSTDLDDINVSNYNELLEYLEKEKKHLEMLEKGHQETLDDIFDSTKSGDADNGKNGNNDSIKIADKKDKPSNQGNEKLQEKQSAQFDKDIYRENTNGNDGEVVKKAHIEDDELSGEEDIKYDNPFDSAEVFYEMGEFKKALNMYKSLANNTPNVADFIWAQFQIANCYRNMKELDKAAKNYQEFINKYPDSFWADQASWYIEDVKWWKKWNSKVRSNDKSLSLSQKTEK